MKWLVVALAILAAGCPSARPKPRSVSPESEATSDDEETRRARLVSDLRDDILTSYDRDDPPDVDTGMIDPRIGTARIGAGPGDVYIAGDLARAPSRWPIDLDPSTRTEVRSKLLDIQLAADESAAWMSDELSWRIEICGRTAVIPLRITALYAHDGDRWVPVFEHLSFGRSPVPLEAPLPKSIKTEVVSGDLRDELSGVLGRGLFLKPHDPSVVAQDAGALVLGPGGDVPRDVGRDADDEWHGAAVLEAKLPAGKLEDRRVGLVGRTPGNATIAYWIGNYIAELPAQPGRAAGKARMRVTHVFEKRRPKQPDRASRDAQSCADHGSDCRWVLIQSHMSQPISDDELTRLVFGDALISPKPLQVDCSNELRLKAPAAEPRRAESPPAARTR